MKHIKDVLIYDDGGKTADRLTFVFPWIKNKANGCVSMVGIGLAPFHPQGFCQHVEGKIGRHLGKRISYVDLNDDCAKVLKMNLAAANVGELIKNARERIAKAEEISARERKEIVQLYTFAGLGPVSDDIDEAFRKIISE